MSLKIIFSIIMIMSFFPLSAQESDSAAVRVEKEPYVMPRNSVYYELWGGSTGAGVYTTMPASARILLLASVPDSRGTVRSIQIKDILSSTRWP